MIPLTLHVIEGYIEEGVFKTQVKEYEVIEYSTGVRIKYRDGSIVTTETPPTLDVFKTGMLRSDNPRVAISTLRGEAVEDYKNKIKHLMIMDLIERRNQVESLLGILRS